MATRYGTRYTTLHILSKALCPEFEPKTLQRPDSSCTQKAKQGVQCSFRLHLAVID